MADKVIITIFTDPMMGLSWEMELVMRKLETHYKGRVEFHNVMSLLVRDVYELVDTRESERGKEYALDRYLERLAAIYREEEAIHHMPIPMKHCRLFSVDQTSTKPLNLAYYAARETAPDKAGQFLYRLRYATVVECRPTTRQEEILRVTGLCGIDQNAFLKQYHGEKVQKEFHNGIDLMCQIGIRSLPAYMIQYRDKAVVMQTFSYEDFVRAIDQVSAGSIIETKPEKTPAMIKQLLLAHPLISLIELREAMGLQDNAEVLTLLNDPEIQKKIETYDVPGGQFVRLRLKEEKCLL